MLSKQPWSHGPRTRAHCFRLRLMALTYLSLPLTSAPANGASPNRDTYLRLPMNMMPLVLPFTGARNGVLDPVQHVPRTHAVVEAFRNASRPSHCPVSNNRNRLIIGAERTVRSAKLCSTSNAQSIHPHHTTPPLTAQALPPRCMQHARSSTQFTRAPQPRPRRLRAKSRLSVHWHVPERFPYR